jgi:hypothetical protein
MKNLRKNLILFLFVGLLVTGIPVIAFCASYCASGDFDVFSALDESCPFTYDSFERFTIVLSALFILPLAGLFIASDRQSLPAGVCRPLFKPPRFFLWLLRLIHLI